MSLTGQRENARTLRERTLRSNLYLLALGAMAPIVVLVTLGGVFLVENERERVREEAVGRVRSMMSAVDAALEGEMASLSALAASRNLERGDLRAFRDEAARVVASHQRWLSVALFSSEGQRLMDLRFPHDASLPSAADRASIIAAAHVRVPTVGNLSVGAAPGVRLRLPVQVPGGEGVRYVLSVGLDSGMFEELLRRQQLPPEWTMGLIDRNKIFVARLPPVPPGTSVGESFRAAIERSPEGWFRGTNLEGKELYTPYLTSPRSGWVLGFGIPAAFIESPAWRALWISAAGTAVALGLGLLLAAYVARRIERPITALAESAAALDHGGDARIPAATGIAQLTVLSQALREAGAAVRERQQLLTREKAALEEADRAKDEFIATLSHELRNPLAALTSAADVLQVSPPESASAVRARNVVARQTVNMTRLVEDLLDVSRVVAGKSGLDPRPMNLADAVHAAFDTVRTAGRVEGHQIHHALNAAWVRADRARMEQITANLLDNALKFTPRGKRIEVSVACEGHDAVLRVADEGEGMTAELAGKAFDLFAQGETGLHRPRGGLGIGLALVKRLVELQGGSVHASSEGPGRGAVFTVRLPLIEPASSSHRHQPAKLRAAGRRGVLVVEDEEDVRTMLREMLALRGHEVHEAANGARALDVIGPASPDVVLVDIGLPDIDGFELAPKLRAAARTSIRLVALTGYGQPKHRERAREAGFDAHLVKPVPADALDAAISEDL